MKVANWYNNKDIQIEEVPTPGPGHNEMLVKVMSYGHHAGSNRLLSKFCAPAK